MFFGGHGGHRTSSLVRVGFLPQGIVLSGPGRRGELAGGEGARRGQTTMKTAAENSGGRELPPELGMRRALGVPLGGGGRLTMEQQ